MFKISAIILLLNIAGNLYSQNYPCNDSIANSLKGRVGPAIDSENIRIGGGRFKAIVKLDTLLYISDSTAIQGVKNEWIKSVEVLKISRSTIIGNDTIQYNIIIEPRKRYYKKIKQYLIKNKITTVPNML